MEEVTVCCKLRWMYKDGSRWCFSHRMFKNDAVPVAELTVDGTWLDLNTRKLGTPSNELREVIMKFPRTDDFKWVETSLRFERLQKRGSLLFGQIASSFH